MTTISGLSTPITDYGRMLPAKGATSAVNTTFPPLRQVTEAYAPDFAKNHPAMATAAKEVKPSFFAKMLSKTPQWFQKSVNWLGNPVSEIGWVNKGLTAAEEKMASAEAKAAEKAAEKGGSKILTGLSKSAGFSKVALGAMKGVGKIVPLATPIIEFAASKMSGDSTGKATTKSILATVGSMAAVGAAVAAGVLSGPVGWGALAIAAAGGIGGSMLGDAICGPNKEEKSEESENTEHSAPANGSQKEFGSMTAHNYIPDAMNPTAGLPTI
jgi:hypothetical protein